MLELRVLLGPKRWRLIFLAMCIISLAALPRYTLCIESLEVSASQDSAEDLEEGYAATLFAKDTILKRNPGNIGNFLKELWEKIPEDAINGVGIKK